VVAQHGVGRRLLLLMFRPVVQATVMVTLRGGRERNDQASLPSMSLESRLGALRRRRRRTFLKQFAAIGPVLVGMSFLLLVAFGGMATMR
jgi:hypothetical protein